MTIGFSCRKCKLSLMVSKRSAGRDGKCPKCGAELTFPATADFDGEPDWMDAAEFDRLHSLPAPSRYFDQRGEAALEERSGSEPAFAATALAEAVPVDSAEVVPGYVAEVKPAVVAEAATAASEGKAEVAQERASPEQEGSQLWGGGPVKPMSWASPVEVPESSGEVEDDLEETSLGEVHIEPPLDDLPVPLDEVDVDIDDEDTEVVTRVGQGPYLTVVSEGESYGVCYDLKGRRCSVLGRDESNEVSLPSSAVSRHHCQIERSGQRFFLTDLGSANGTVINGEATISVELKEGDAIQIGDILLRFSEDED